MEAYRLVENMSPGAGAAMVLPLDYLQRIRRSR